MVINLCVDICVQSIHDVPKGIYDTEIELNITHRIQSLQETQIHLSSAEWQNNENKAKGMEASERNEPGHEHPWRMKSQGVLLSVWRMGVFKTSVLGRVYVACNARPGVIHSLSCLLWNYRVTGVGVVTARWVFLPSCWVVPQMISSWCSESGEVALVCGLLVTRNLAKF